ncbi:alkaline phosphatase, tissue-nonspecific isozyme [alpha proteobacterium Q-1]|nr:alkaline phosphatase [Iodidimonas nitroreducens]GAK32286.1 alkaline phosphatase, tissue-nonspecific isozyme [alpha proteobacterium Q-1]
MTDHRPRLTQSKCYTGGAFALALIALLAINPAQAQNTAPNPSTDLSADPWWVAGKSAIEQRLTVQKNENRAKNIILFIGDGMGISTLTAMRIYDGQSRGESGEENIMPYERFPHSALIKTYNHNAQVADSAGTASAMMTGVKTNIGVINMAARHPVGHCGDWPSGQRSSFAEKAAQAGQSIGVVTTARLTHATPATVYAHSPSRDWEDDTDIPAEAKAAGCKDIATQLLDFGPKNGKGLTVAMGGGRGQFLPKETKDPEYPDRSGNRADGRDLTQEWLQRHDRAAFVTSLDQLSALDLAKTDHLLGLFEPSHMKFDSQRAKDLEQGTGPGEPSLADMTGIAIDMLRKNDKGYFLMVEGGRIDHAHHGGNAFNALQDGQAFARAVATALDKVDINETLILVTADHSHVFTMAGYPARGNPILGLVSPPAKDGSPSHEPALAADGKAYTTLGYGNGPGAIKGERPDPAEHDTKAPGYQQQALVPLPSETHAGEDVALFATGPWAHLAGGVLEQNVIYHIMDHASTAHKAP